MLGQVEVPGIGPGTTRVQSFARSGVGRIVEVRVRRLAEMAEVESLNAGVLAAVHIAGPGAVICADYRRVSPLQHGIADAWSRAMRKANRSIARSAILVDPTNTMFNLQLERIVRCAGNPRRRFFADLEELHLWLDGDLMEPERQALQAFLATDES